MVRLLTPKLTAGIEGDFRARGPARVSGARPATTGEAGLLRIPVKKTKGSDLTIDQQSYNAVHGALRALGERANPLLKTTFKVLRRIRGCPWRIGDITAAALVLLHLEHGRTT